MKEMNTASGAMQAHTRRFLEAAISSPSGARAVEQEMQDALSRDYVGAPGVAELISLAHAALTLSEVEEVGPYRVWYAEQAKQLLCRAADAVSMLERPASAMN